MTNKVGLVLSGGGVRGAYEVGVVKYLSENGICPDVYSGASIGSLNGAVLASSNNFHDGVKYLEKIWHSLSINEVIQINYKALLAGFIFVAIQQNVGTQQFNLLPKFLELFKEDTNTTNYLSMLMYSPFNDYVMKSPNDGLFSNENIKSLLSDILDFDNLKNGSPLWVSIYPSRGTIIDIFEYILAESHIIDTNESEYIQIQTLSKDDQVTALLASAAIPLIFSSQVVNGKKYADGGLGGYKKSSGNTPIKPIINSKCNWCFVIHLSDGSLWDRNDFPETTIIEIRPEKFLTDGSMFKNTIDFSPSRIRDLMQQGYDDAKRCIGNSFTAIEVIHKSRRFKEELISSCSELEDDEFERTKW